MMLELRKLDFEYPDGTPVFSRFDWQVQRGEPWAVLGPSGCGKTTLLYLLAGLLKPTSGEILVEGQPLERPRPRTGLILQDYGLLPWATVAENARLGLRVRAFYGPDGRHAPSDENVTTDIAQVDPWLERLGLLTLKDQYPSQLSGGQRQRTAIARTLILNPDLLLMDEPFASLDVPTRESLQDLILDLWREHALTTIIVTHTIEEAAVLGQKILVLLDPPIHRARIIDNPTAGNPDFRNTEAYRQTVTILREALEVQA
ncbi:MAG: ATP-binding cassette domain-containing protein [Anaerolineales bacterium]|jgi:NitT/TauT family transport system ATP-binding protein